jgi:uncharacterized protein (TIGR02677 family)
MQQQDGAPARPFAHVDAPNSELYRRIMCVFVAEKQRFVVHLRPEDVAEALRGDGGPPPEEKAVGDALAALEEWHNLRSDPDTGRVATVEDFYRARFLYQLTIEGEAAELALATYEEAIGRRGELQAVALEDISVRLRSLYELAQQAAPDAARVHNLLLELSGRLDSLAGNAGVFMSSLQRTIDLQDVDEDAFLAYKDRLIAYLERFVSELVMRSHEIATTLRALDAAGIDALLRSAAEREAGDVAPDEHAEGGEPSPVEVKLGEWRNRWSGLASWFVGDRTHPSQASLLRQRARKAIPDLLATISTLQERRAGRSDRSADFRALARWFAEAPTDADAHRLWRAAFGLAPSRHLTCDAEHDDGGVRPATSWQDAPPVPIAPRLRATGRYAKRGAPAKVADRSAERERLAREIAAEAAQTEEIRRRLATGHPGRLAELAALDEGEFRFFLGLLGEALAAGPPDERGIVETVTTDGTLHVALEPTGDGAVAEIVTPAGTLRGPDHTVTITDLTVPTVPTGELLEMR